MNVLPASVINSLINPVLLIAADRTVSFANRAARDLLGRDPTGVDLALSLRHPTILEAIDRTLRDGEIRSEEISMPGIIRQTFQLHVSLLEDQDDPDPDLVVMVVLQDMTAAIRADQMRVDFVANASHELRSPLSAILGFIETLQGPARNDDQARMRFLSIMHRETLRMSRLINDLLSLSRVEIDEHVRPQSHVNVKTILKNVLEILSPQAEAKGMHFDFNSVTFNPEDAVIVPGDSDQLIQLFRNLLENAIHYGFKDSEIMIRIEHAATGSGIIVRITDQGIGIAKDDIPRLTERFYRVDQARSHHSEPGKDEPISSTGLGLAIVKHILRRHRGRLTVESEPGVGSTFQVYLPTVDGD